MHMFFQNIYDLIMNSIIALGPYGPVLGCLLIVLESVLPMLPLFVFITFNFIAFGSVFGFIISWICTVLGCILSYTLINYYLSDYVIKKFSNKPIFLKTINSLEKLSLQRLTIIIAIPFTPAFLINIAAGIAKIDLKKFIIAISIGKIFLVIFWGVIGTSLIESLKHPIYILYVVIMVVIAYIISNVINKLFKIN